MDLESICFSTLNMPPGKETLPEEVSGQHAAWISREYRLSAER